MLIEAEDGTCNEAPEDDGEYMVCADGIGEDGGGCCGEGRM